MPVPTSVLAAWGLLGTAVPLEGGQGTSIRVGDVVLKPYADDAHVAWVADLCARLPDDVGVRVPAPVPALDGRLVVEGWTASAYAEGEPVHDDDRTAASWLPVLAAGRGFHAAVASETRPPFLEHRTHRWALADRCAWGEQSLDEGPRSASLLARLRRLVVDEGLEPQLVHGDLSGNVLLADGLPPAVIDLSPYWRPAAYADAVVVVDALLWWRSDDAVVALGRPAGLDTLRWRSLLARATVFRLLAFDEPSRDAEDVADQLPRYAEVVHLLDADPWTSTT